MHQNYLCHCRIPCTILECRNGANKGKFFVACPKKECKFFKWVLAPSATSPPPPSNTTTNSSSSNVNTVQNNPEEIPTCPTHQEICKQFQVKKPDSPNFGKYFFKCCVRDAANDECKFFKWCKHHVPVAPSAVTSTSSRSEYIELEVLEWKFSSGVDMAIAIQMSCNEKLKELSERLKPLSIQQVKEKKDTQLIINFKDYSKALPLLQQFCNQFSYHLFAIPRFVLEIVNSKEFKNSGGVKQELNLEPFEEYTKLIPRKVLQSMLPFQKQTLQFGLERNGKLFIGDEMGLGKTLQSIALMCCYIKDWPLLIICPASLKQNWKNELLRWIDTLAAEDVQILETKNDEWKESLVKIASYELASSDPMLKQIENATFQAVICDESHYLKSDATKRTKALYPILSKSKRTILLSGTISPSRPIEIYSQIKALGVFPPNDFSKKEFGQRYCMEVPNHKFDQYQQQQYNGARNLRELNFILSHRVMIRRLKMDVIKDLPKKKRQQVLLQLKQEELQEYKELQGTSAVHQYDKSKVTKLYQETCRVKLVPVCNYLKQFTRNNPQKKFLIFAHHIDMLDALEKYIKETLKVDYIRIDGTTASTKRQPLVDRFKTENDCLVALLSITAASTGLDFTPATTVIFAELSWIPGLHLQAEDRIHRLTSKENCDIRYLIAKNTLDEYMWRVLMKKIDVVGQTVDGNELKENENWKIGGQVKWNQEDTNQMTLDTFLSNKRKYEKEKENVAPSTSTQPPMKKQKILEHSGSGSTSITKYLLKPNC